MEKKNRDLEETGTTYRRRKRKSTMYLFKKRMKALWTSVKQCFARKKSKKKKAKKTGDGASWQKKTIVILLNVLGMVAFVFLIPYFTLIWLDSYTNHGEEYKVPSVHGRELADAVKILENNKLDYKIIKKEYCDTVPQDVVLQMYPDSGSVVKEGRKIGLVLSTTEKPRRTIPSVIDNRTFSEARLHIEAAGFVIERIDTIDGDEDWVYEVLYRRRPLANGDVIPEGSGVVVVIGNGKKSADKGEPEFVSDFGI